MGATPNWAGPTVYGPRPAFFAKHIPECPQNPNRCGDTASPAARETVSWTHGLVNCEPHRTDAVQLATTTGISSHILVSPVQNTYRCLPSSSTSTYNGSCRISTEYKRLRAGSLVSGWRLTTKSRARALGLHEERRHSHRQTKGPTPVQCPQCCRGCCTVVLCSVVDRAD